MSALNLNDKTFKTEIENYTGVALVDCWAPWCGPCRMVGPVIDKLAIEYAGKVKISKLNVDDSQETSVRYGISSIPTIMIFVDGKVVDGFVGAQPEAAIRAKLDKFVK
jgi:thioredoxin 1